MSTTDTPTSGPHVEVRTDRRSVLPWRRHHSVDVEVAPLVQAYAERHRRTDTALIETAFELARTAHVEQVRRSGEPYITHPLGVALILADLGLDDVTLAAALLHDAVEDTSVTEAEIERLLGREVAEIVDGVTKLDRLQFDSKEAQQAATLRKMLVAMAKDIRVLLIKLADRLHNMRTLASLPEFKQKRIAQETLDIYAPLAHRLGIADVKWQLEDLAFAVLYPQRYAEIEQMVWMQAPEREEFLQTVLTELRARLGELHIEAEVTGRPKHYWSIYEKMITRGKQFDDVQDLVGVRVVVDQVKDCYAALGSIHAMWRPVQGRFKDYIAMPKFNLYQSLHTTVVGPTGKAVEVQIRTQEMHRRAEYGIAAHWGYKEREPADDLLWLQRMVDWQQETSDPGEFMESLKIDLEYDEVFVFTPKGKVITLASGATPVDFAYAIHTDVGHRCIGARVNGRLVPLDSSLVSGDTVEIFTSKVEGAGPSRDWLQFVRTPKARTKIRQWFSRERRVDAIDSGREDLAKAMRKEGLPVQKLATSDTLKTVAEALHYGDLEALHAAIGENHVSAKAVVQRLQRELRGGEEQLPVTTARPPRPARENRRRATGVHVEGLDDVMVRLSRCCTPVPGDEIMGFVTRGRGVSVHRTDCANAAGLVDHAERLIEVEWDHDQPATFVVSVEVEALDRSRLLRDVANVLAEYHVNILSCTSQTSTDRVAKFRFDFELADPSHLESILWAVKRVDGVYAAYRVLPGHARERLARVPRMAVRAFEARAIEPYEDGRAFGSAGPYEVVRGVVRHAVDPRTAAAQRVVDLEHAPMADDGTVRFDADVVVLRPVDATRGARTLVYSVANRGMVASLPMSSGAFAMPGASDRIEPGDGFLLERGLTVAWSGWQWDVPRGPGMVGLDAPEARAGDGGPLPGQVRMRLQPAADAPSVPLTGMALLPQPPPYRPLDPEDPDAVLTARERPEDDGWVVPRATWRFGRDDDGAFVVDPTALWVEGGLRGGLIYDVVYRPHRSPVVGAGLLAIRDTVSWLRWGSRDNPLAGRVDLVCATGASQSGRLLRQFLFDRMNADDDGRPVFDGVHVHIAGGRRGEFNVRFGQPGVIWRGVGDEPPWSTAALLDSQRAVGCAPKVLVTNSASEYWRGDAWLAHGDAETGRDLDDPAGVRHYLFSGVDHFGDLGELGALVPPRNAAAGLDATVVERALFTALEAWVRDGVEPPPSRVPRIDDGTATERAPVLALLATREALATPDPDALPGVGPALVSEVDGDGNEVAGVRLPAVAAPVATYAGWNVRPPLSGLPSLVPDFVGSRVPLPDVGTRYHDRAAYERAARAAAEALAAQGYLLAADVDLAVAQAVAKFPSGRADTGVAGR